MGAIPPEDVLINRRKEGYKAVEAIWSARRSSNRWPVTLREIAALTGLSELDTFSAARWLVKHGLILKVPKGYMPNKFRFSDVCWIHGMTKRETGDCGKCLRRFRWKQ